MIERRKSGSLLPVLALAALFLVVMLTTQNAVAAALGGMVARVWVSVMDVVLRLLAAMFGRS